MNNTLSLITILLMVGIIMEAFLPLTQADDELIQICGGDDQLLVNCIGDSELIFLNIQEQISSGGINPSTSIIKTDEKEEIAKFKEGFGGIYIFLFVILIGVLVIVFIYKRRKEKYPQKKLI